MRVRSRFRAWLIPGGKALALALVISTLGLLGLPYAAGASNTGPGGARIWVGDEVVGPYRLLVSSGPDPATVGPLTILVQVKDPQTGAMVKDATVSALLVGSDGTQLTADLTHKDAGNPVDYVAHLQIDKPQSWEVHIRVAGPAGVSNVQYTQPVSSPRTASTLLAVGLPFLVVLGGLILLFVRRSGPASEESEEQAQEA
jgi:hypothetical protein